MQKPLRLLDDHLTAFKKLSDGRKGVECDYAIILG
jgi:hypothetical protein